MIFFIIRVIQGDVLLFGFKAGRVESGDVVLPQS